jgi:hypothetical protein
MTFACVRFQENDRVKLLGLPTVYRVVRAIPASSVVEDAMARLCCTLPADARF